MFQTPIRKRGAFVSKVVDGNGKAVKLKLSGSKIIAIHKLSNDNGYMLKLWLPKSSLAYDTIANMDDTAFEAVLKNNQKWFHNDLTEDQIKEYFRYCLDKETLCILVSSVMLPRSIYIENQLVDDFQVLFEMERKDISKLSVTCNIEVQGLYFYPNRFGIRWILRDIYLSNDIPDELDPLEMCDRAEMESFWNHELGEVVESIENDIQILENKIQKLTQKRDTMKGLFETACHEPEISSTWAKHLEQLKHEIFEYVCGRL